MDLAALSTPNILTHVWGQLPIEMWRAEAQAALAAVRTTTDSPSSIVQENFQYLAVLRDMIDFEKNHPSLILYHLNLLHIRYFSALQRELWIRALTKRELVISAFASLEDKVSPPLSKRIRARVRRDYGRDVNLDYIEEILESPSAKG